MKNKKWLLVLIIAFPSAFWLILEMSTINSNKLPFYGRKQVEASGDTLYQIVNSGFFKLDASSTNLVLKNLKTDSFGVFALVLLHEKYRKDGFRLEGLTEYLTYKKSKIMHIPLVVVSPDTVGASQIETDLKQLSIHGNVHFLRWPSSGYDSLIQTYFINKPYYIDYSFVVLVDGNRHIRGYYDSRYASEVKRLIGEYQHLRLKEEKQKMSDANEIKPSN